MATVPRQFRIVSSSTVPHYMGKHNPAINGGIVAEVQSSNFSLL